VRNADTPGGWTEADSEKFAEWAHVFVPSRDEQLETLGRLIPAQPDEACTIVELGAGDGVLASRVLARFPSCRYLALDGSGAMRRRLRASLARFGRRAAVGDFALESDEWRTALPQPLRCVLASLVVHHLSAEGKKKLFRDLAARIEPGGALIVADLVEAAAPPVAGLFADQWDQTVRDQSVTAGTHRDAFDDFTADRWNYYRLEVPDPVDQPSRLLDQLIWLREGGFHTVDCFCMRAGHAIFGGFAS
jgi:tRNA (cmo5U34)-methyltransferase